VQRDARELRRAITKRRVELVDARRDLIAPDGPVEVDRRLHA